MIKARRPRSAFYRIFFSYTLNHIHLFIHSTNQPRQVSYLINSVKFNMLIILLFYKT